MTSKEMLADFVIITIPENIEDISANLLGPVVINCETNVGRQVISLNTDYTTKHRILDVDTGLIERHGAVSAEVAGAMAEGIRFISGADIGVSTTGIAGPGGGSTEKPVGLLYMGLSSDSGTETKKLQLVEDRLINKRIMSQYVMNMLRLHVKKDRE